MKKKNRLYQKSESMAYSSGPASAVCPECDGKKYILVSSQGVGKSTVYEKKPCQRCMDIADEWTGESIPVTQEKKRNSPNGTGYLRTRKRRRKNRVES